MAEILLNPVFLGVLIMLLLALMRMNVVIALVMGALVAGISGKLSILETLRIFNNGLGAGASIALNYALLGAFAGAVSHSGIPEWLVMKATKRLRRPGKRGFVRKIRFGIVAILLGMSILCKNLLPVHIAFIPILVPPLLGLMSKVRLDRRLLATTMTFGLVSSYMVIPLGFGYIFLHDIFLENLHANGMPDATISWVLKGMILPVLGMLLGLVLAIFRYRKPKAYQLAMIKKVEFHEGEAIQQKHLWLSLFAIIGAFTVQILAHNNMVAGTLFGLMVFWLGGIIHWAEVDDVITSGFKMMTLIGMIMIAAAGFTAVIRASGGIDSLVAAMISVVHGSKVLAALLMCLIGLLVTMGIGSAFATVPILAVIYLPFCAHMGFSPFATIAILGAASVAGDPGSPASDSTLGPSSGLGIDGQYDHMKDCVIPTFVYFNIPLVLFGWLAGIVL